MTLEQILGLAPVVPVLIVEDPHSAVPLARALMAGGLYALEITLRTPTALESIRRIVGEIEGAVVGAGTILDPAMREAAAKAGAQFGVSPGLVPNDSFDGPLPMLPGVATATELMAGLDRGHTYFKLFPANVVGGVGALKAFASPFQQAKFCPTGGVSLQNAPDYLGQHNCVCVGGSWVAPADAIRDGDWARIEVLAREAARLR